MSRTIIHAVALTSLVLLSGCGGAEKARPEPIVVTQKYGVPVAVDCVPPTLRPAPDYPDTDEALRTAPDAAARYQLMASGRPLRMARLGELEPVVAGCQQKKAAQ